MADSLNPFLAEDDLIENKIEEETYQPEIVLPVETRELSPNSVTDPAIITVDNIAGKLLKDNFILTALEFHTELVESGRDLPRLRDFFSNPSNFERTKLDTSPPGLRRFKDNSLAFGGDSRMILYRACRVCMRQHL